MLNDGTGALWQEVLAEAKTGVSEPTYETALKNASVRVDKGRVTLVFPEPFMLRMITPEGSRLLEEAFKRHLGEACQLILIAEHETDTDADDGGLYDTGAILDHLKEARETLTGEMPAVGPPSSEVRRAHGFRLNPRYTFDQFVVGNHNQLAHAAAQAVAREPGSVYNPLFVYALTGLGKTHLLQAIGHEVLKTRPEARVCYVTSEAFTNELIEGIQHRERMPGFHRKYRSVDVLLIDDIQFLIGKVATQEAFFHTFNTLHELGRQVVISSDRPPADLDTLEERLTSRFEWGLTADISKPDYETRLAILHKKNHTRGFELPSDLLARIASCVDSNVRELEGALTKVSAHQRLLRRSLMLEEVDDVLAHLRRSLDSSRTPAPNEIMEEVAAHFQVDVDDLKGERRTARITVPRQVAMYFSRELTHLSLKDIGQAFGGKDHTTVIYALNRVEERLGVDEAFARDMMLIRARLRERFRPPDA
jgi:chromosomal replication initiator protein